MNVSENIEVTGEPSRTNGSGAAALLSAGIGLLALAILAVAGDKSAAVKNSLVFYRPTGPLSGVTTLAVILWLAVWAVLEGRWRRKTVALGRICFVAFIFLGLSFLLTFPPFVDLL